MYSWLNNWFGEGRQVFIFLKSNIGHCLFEGTCFLWDSTCCVPIKQMGLVIVVCKWSGYGRRTVTQHQLRIWYQMFLSSYTLYTSPNMDSASVLMSLSTFSSERRFRYLVAGTHWSSTLEIFFPCTEKLPLRNTFFKFVFVLFCFLVQGSAFVFGF